jgi:Kef-type K+ transport system membrane component KefB
MATNEANTNTTSPALPGASPVRPEAIVIGITVPVVAFLIGLIAFGYYWVRRYSAKKADSVVTSAQATAKA